MKLNTVYYWKSIKELNKEQKNTKQNKHTHAVTSAEAVLDELDRYFKSTTNWASCKSKLD